MRKALVLFCVLFLAGTVMECKKQDVNADKAAIRKLVLNDRNWFNATTKTDSSKESTWVQLGADTVLIWWRGAQTFNDPIVNIEVAGDSAYVDWMRSNKTGDLNLLIKVPDTSWQLWVKKVWETARIRGVFARVGSTNDSTRGWALKKISLAAGVSDSVNTVRIDSLRIQSTSYPNYVIHDPLNTFYRIDSLVTFRPGESVTLTLYTNAADGDAFLHTFILSWPWYVRVKFNSLGNGVFTGTWPAQVVEFPRFAIFDLMNHRTLYMPPTVFGYDFSGWLLPYNIKASE